jgi:pimeloyl-ACP methyl ester carboxylesterase
MTPMNPSDSSRFVSVNGIRLHVCEAGPVGGPAVVLLHGFPEFWYSWREQIRFLADRGFRVMAPDLRGYNLSEKPGRVGDYGVEQLVGDVIGLIEQTAGGRAALVGHDWGGVIAWFAAMRQPERIEKLIILNAPHPAAYLRELRRPSQLLRSWYALFFQLPWLPERVMRRNDFAALRSLFRDGPARKSPTREADVQRYVEALAHPGALTAMINYYRAALRGGRSTLQRQIVPIQIPTLLIWGEHDRYLVPELADGLERWVPDLRVERLKNATHWVQNDEPDEVNRLLAEFLE